MGRLGRDHEIVGARFLIVLMLYQTIFSNIQLKIKDRDLAILLARWTLCCELDTFENCV